MGPSIGKIIKKEEENYKQLQITDTILIITNHLYVIVFFTLYFLTI